MKKYLYLFILFTLIFGCSTQKKLKKIPKEELTILRTSFDGNGCKNEITIFSNSDNFNQYQKSFIIPGKKNSPLDIVDFSDKKIAVICKMDISNYDASELIVNKKKGILKLTKSNTEFDDSINTLFLEIPKEIHYLILEY
ncbi:hypothetical protein N5D03_05255 [Empedobacter sp. GD03861]|uniref:hypothetical protein n=1 Tax=Empedobacter sp. GD03861 TaxID=2975390 RepID=UPI002446E3CB|nr:hypothetical protein [Empedobacter sp. GD03861]MDH0673938.1 hypothetical protein [Empedobacter sp. GD03861]